ncbi:MAG: MFS transporter [Deltaproteobacteria bacterium]|nr:MFS transporter [Deltaproteobacteria bacterium]
MKVSYIGKLSLVLGLTWGLGGLDRLMVAFAAPGYMPALGLDFTQLGLIAAANAFGVAIGAWTVGPLSEFYGRRLGAVWGNLAEHVFSALSGLVGSFFAMFGVRGLMGTCVGALYGPSYAAISEEAPPERRGHYVGFAQSFWPLIGMGFGPVLAGYLMTYVGWRWSFFVVAVPGVCLTLWLARFMREPPSTAENIRRRRQTGASRLVHEGREVHFWDVLKYRNILLTSLLSIGSMAYLYVLFTFVPVFFGKVHGLNAVETGWVMCGGGFLVWAGQNLMPRVSDRIGRKPALAILYASAAVGGALFATAPTHASFVRLALYFTLFCAGLASYPIFLGLVPTESVPFTIAATAVALPQGLGEVIGATVFPAVGGRIADVYGLPYTMWMVVAACTFCLVATVFLKETAPVVLAARARSGGARPVS